LREKDAIFTFNWDPFLLDAYERNFNKTASMPRLFFLHGNVRIGYCINEACSGKNLLGKLGVRCQFCNSLFIKVPLFYPVMKKDYSQHSSEYIRDSWNSANQYFKDAFTLTIFGYGAPSSDMDAVMLLKKAWLDRSPRVFEHIEIIDIADSHTLHERWHDFAPTNHYRILTKFEESRLWRCPRRSCESLLPPMENGEVVEDCPFPNTDDLVKIQEYARNISTFETPV
jgi:hypothetical protein